jgi:hypothetical protein
MIHLRKTVAMLVAMIVVASSIAASPGQDSARVLFLGNSITYVGNLPAVLSAVCEASGHRCPAEMIVQGGGTLSERVADHSLERAAANGPFEFVVLQERGGDLIGASMTAARAKEAAGTAAATLVSAAHPQAMNPVLLGTYQTEPEASRQLVSAERELAARLDSPYVPISNYLACGRRAHPSMRWFYEDGVHPGPDLTLLMAVLLHREMFGSWPTVRDIEVRAPLYRNPSGLNANGFASAQPVVPGTPVSFIYHAATVRLVLDVARAPCADRCASDGTLTRSSPCP